MNNTTFRLMVYVLCFLGGAGYDTIYAQNQTTKLIINSNPAGALVQLKGNLMIFGQTPFQIKHDLNGNYQIKVSNPGFETLTEQITFMGETPKTVEFSLTPKTRWRAAWRSTIFPGWGQFYSERKLKGILFTSAFWSCFSTALYYSVNYSQKAASYSDAKEILNQFAVNSAAYHELWPDVFKEYQATNQSRKQRQKWIGVTISLLVMNIIDTVVLFPSFGKNKLTGGAYRFSMLPTPGGLNFGVTNSF